VTSLDVRVGAETVAVQIDADGQVRVGDLRFTVEPIAPVAIVSSCLASLGVLSPERATIGGSSRRSGASDPVSARAAATAGSPATGQELSRRACDRVMTSSSRAPRSPRRRVDHARGEEVELSIRAP
jgi:hypothetical protein